MKPITLCADDYALHPAVSEAIRLLAEQGRIHAISCLVTTPRWSEDARWLTDLADQVDIGLHLNFTEGLGLTAPYRLGYPSLYNMLVMSHLRALNERQLIAEISAQWQRFTDMHGQTPDFIDGHQHVHHLPQVRQALLAVLQAEKPRSLPWLRSVVPLIGPMSRLKLKGMVIKNSGAIPWRAALHCRGYATNTAFAGVYSLSPKQAYRPLMQRWLTDLPNGGLIMCHPGRLSEHCGQQPLDHGPARQQEFNYLASEPFHQDCQQAGVTLQRLSIVCGDQLTTAV